MILRRLACALGLAVVLAGAAATPAHAAPVNAGVHGIDVPAEFPQGYLWKFRISGFVNGTGADPVPVDPAAVRFTFTVPAGVTYVGPGEGDSSGSCDLADGVLTCRPEAGPATESALYAFPVELRIGADTAIGTKLPFRLALDVEGGEDTYPVDDVRTFASTVAGSADMGLAVKDLVVAGNAVTYTVVLHNYGPQTTTKFTFHETYTVINWHGTGVGPGATCRFTAAKNQCTIRRALAPGQETEVKRTVPIPANSPWRGTKVPVELEVYDSPSNFAGSTWFVNRLNPDNDKTGYVADLTGLAPPASPTPSPTPSATASPAPGGGGGGDLPITGAATMPLLAGGVLLLIVGAGAVLVGRRRR